MLNDLQKQFVRNAKSYGRDPDRFPAEWLASRSRFEAMETVNNLARAM